MVPMKTGGMRSVIDLSILHKIYCFPFQNENQQINLDLYSQRNCRLPTWTFAYFYILISMHFRKCLCYVLNHKIFQFLALRFGLVAASQCFTRVVVPLHNLCAHAHYYLHDYLLKESNLQSLSLYRHTGPFLYFYWI